MNTTHRLDALHGENPLGFLAALGALVLLPREQREPLPQLAWEADPPHAAVLDAAPATRADLAEKLHAALTAPDAPTPRRAVGERKLKELTLDQYREQAAALDDLTATLLAGICSDATAGAVPERGPLVMTSGPQDFPKSIADARAELAGAGADATANALFGPWRYVAGHPLGFDPSMEKRHAYLAAKPERDAERVPVALLLAVTALAALPLFPTLGRRGFANALFKDRRWERMTWPLWSAPLSLPVVRSLIHIFVPETHGQAKPAGLVAAYAAERGGVETAGGVYYILRPGRRLW
jgi:hypothetical protein